MIARTMLAFFFCSTIVFGEVHHTSDLGWKPGQDVTSDFATLFHDGTVSSGDELVLDHTYRIRGTHSLPDDITLSAAGGGGFDVVDATDDNQAVFLTLGNRTILRNLTVTYVNTPEPSPQAGTNPTRGVHFFPRIGIHANGKSDLRIEHCRLVGSIGHQIKLSDCGQPKVIGCHIVGGYWTVYLTGGVTDAVFRHCVIEKCQGDAIKTGRGNGASGVKRVLVEDCVFQDCGRDGIDTTGGWDNSIVRNSTFRRLFSGLDIKSYFEKPEHFTMDCMNSGILIENCKFTDMANCVTFSTLDRGLVRRGDYFLNTVTAQRYAPHDVDINDCVFERTGGSGVRMLLLKGGHSIRYKNALFRGENVQVVRYTNVFQTFGAKSLSKEVSEALNYGVSGTLGPEGPAAAPGDRSVAFAYGPRPAGSR
jgi:hypothetical protein